MRLKLERKVAMKKKTKKSAEAGLLQLLQTHIPPPLDPGRRRAMLMQLSAMAMDMDYLPRQSFAEKILTQASYLSRWIWLAQAALLTLFYYYAFQPDRAKLNACALSLAPCLIFMLTAELCKTFQHNMWEMEAACRYNLATLLFLRLCILSGTDFLVLGGALTVFCMTGGALWQFALYTLLPFFLTSALCLWLLRHWGRHCNAIILTAVSLLFGFFEASLSRILLQLQERFHSAGLEKAVLLATAAAMLLFFINSILLCFQNAGKIFYKRKGNQLWSLE